MAGQSYNLTCNVSEPTNVTMISYQWKKEGGPLDNETGETLVFSSLHLSDAGNYTCEILVQPMTNRTSNNWTIIPQGTLFYNS